MQRKWWVVGLCALVGATVACAESAKDAIAALQSSIGGTQLVLRNFNGEDKVLATWTGTQSTLAPARWHTMGVLQLGSVKLSGHKLTLQCVRHVLVKDGPDQLALYSEPTNVQIEVDLGDADPAVVLSKIKDDLFFASVGDAVGAIPKDWKRSIPARVLDTRIIDKGPVAQKASLANSQPACDCAEKENPACEADKRPRQGIVPPKFLKGKDPEFTDAVRQGFVDAHVLVGLKVDESGRPNDVWVLSPVGKGLDEEAAKAVLTYVFRPAMCHDAPVAVFLNVDVRFQRN